MNRSTVGAGLAIAAILFANVFVGLIASVSGQSDGRSLRWDRYDVTIDNVDTATNRFDVTESYVLTIETGPFSYGFADIPLDRMTGIERVAVYEGNTALRASCSGFAGTYCAAQEGETFSIRYYFTRPAQSGDQRSIRIIYRVRGALRSYSAGDQLYWVAVPGDRPFPVRESRVTVVLPSDRPPQVIASYPNTWQQSVSGTTITWTAPGSLGTDGSVEVRVQYPHDPRMSKPDWQAAYDREQAYLDNWQPIVSLFLLALTLLFTLGGVVLVVTRYLSHGRDPQALVVPEYLAELPGDERPGMVGLLLDEKADMKDIMATLVDLARRGYFVIEQTTKGGVLGLFASHGFEFHRTDKPATDLLGFEQTLLNGLFPKGRTDTSLADLRTKFYQHIPAIKQQMYRELVRGDYFKRSPETTRALWIWGGLAAVVVASLLFWGARVLTLISPLIILPPIGLGIVGAAAALAGNYMPAKTTKGAQAAARWRAFRRYLQNIEHYGDVGQAAQKFEEALAYAIAFGIEQDLVRQLVPALTTMPGWYIPGHLGGPWSRGYRQGPLTTGGGSGMGDFTLGGPGGLNDMSRSLTDGLNAMSSGLTQMLNDASRAMTSRPQSSGSRGGFGGGGRSGGGGSGGGSRGFG